MGDGEGHSEGDGGDLGAERMVRGSATGRLVRFAVVVFFFSVAAQGVVNTTPMSPSSLPPQPPPPIPPPLPQRGDTNRLSAATAS